MKRPFPWIRLAPVALALALTSIGAGAGSLARAKDVGERTVVALLPLENLTGRSELGERFSRLVWASIGRDPRFHVTDVGEVETAIGEVRIRNAGLVSREQVQRLARRLGVRWIFAGTLLECGTLRTPDGDVPTVGLALRLIDGTTGRVVWADQRFRSGEDRELVFAWGRINDITQLAARTAAELVKDIRLPAAGDTTSVRRRAP